MSNMKRVFFNSLINRQEKRAREHHRRKLKRAAKRIALLRNLEKTGITEAQAERIAVEYSIKASR